MSGRETKNSLVTDVTDRQLTVFYILLGLGCLAHEWYWYKRYIIQPGSNLSGYLDSFRELMPTPELAFPFVILIHVLFILWALLTIIDKRRPLWSALQLPTIIALFFLLGMKVPNHFFFLILVYAVHAAYLVLGCYYWRKQDVIGVALNRNYLRLNLLILLCTTYFVAALFKINPVFLNLESTSAAKFVYPPLWPIHYGLKFFMGREHVIQDWMMRFYGVVGIATTYAIEFGLPILFCVPRWRRIGLAVGLLFHLVIVSFSAIDFSMVVFAIYPLVLKGQEVEDFLSNYVFRPSRRILVTTSIVGVYFCSVAVLFGLINLPVWARWFEIYRFVHIFAVAYIAILMCRFAQQGLRSNVRSASLVPDAV